MSLGAVAGLVSVMVGVAWWVLSGALLARRKSPELFTRRWWGERGIYTVGFAFFFLGLSQVRQEMGWPGFAIGLASAAAVLLVALVAAVVIKRHRASRSGMAGT